MSRTKGLLVALAAAAFIAQVQSGHAACTPPSFTPEEQKPIPTANINQVVLSTAIVKQTNYYRCQRGLKPLDHDPRLISAAEIHASNMARLNRLSHTLPISGERTLRQRFSAADVDVKKIRAENVGTEYRMAFGTDVFMINDAPNCKFTNRETLKPIPVHSYGSLAHSLVKNLWNSSSHRKNILNRKASRVGSAAEFTIAGHAPCGTYFVSQDFAG